MSDKFHGADFVPFWHSHDLLSFRLFRRGSGIRNWRFQISVRAGKTETSEQYPTAHEAVAAARARIDRIIANIRKKGKS